MKRILAFAIASLCACSGAATAPDGPAAAADAPAAAPDASVAAPDAGAFPTTVQRYDIIEQSLPWPSAGYGNPWDQVTVTMTLTPPHGHNLTVGGFYAAPDLWKARFAPSQTGAWTWRATITDGTKSSESSGAFTVTDSPGPGYLRMFPDNPMRWVFDDGTPFAPVGINDCIVTTPGDPSSIYKYWGFDGPDPQCSVGKCERRVDIDTYLSAFSEAGVNVFRWGIGLCGFDVKKDLGPAGYVYGLEESDWGDKLLAKMRAYGLRNYVTLWAFNYRPPPSLDAAKKYAKYVVDRYGAYTDFWELTNEFPNPPETIDSAWYTEISAYIRSIDPYAHPIGTSWERPDLEGIEINAPHWYITENELESDTVTTTRVAGVRAEAGARTLPIVFSEHGNTGVNWDPRSALRMRIRTWTAFFVEASYIFWNESSTKGMCPPKPAECNNPAANIYLGPEERGYLKAFSDFARGVDARAGRLEATVDVPDKVRVYALRSDTVYAAYLHAYTDHTNPTVGVKLTVEPRAAGTATWTNPATGAVLGTAAAVAGTQTLDVPSFTTDIALKIR
jgi:hypothetical protein